MPPKSNVPIRIGGSKVRTGCKACKRRHLKCDERRPVCLRCEKAKFQCVYETVTPQRTPPPDLSSISFYGVRDVEEITAVRSFITYLGPELVRQSLGKMAGCFSRGVWCNELPKIAESEQVVWDALVAVGMLSTSTRLGHIVDPAVRKYNKAIQSLHLRMKSEEESQQRCQDVILLSCLLFTLFECLQDNVLVALKHITGGMKLLMEWESGNASQRHQAYLDRKTILPIFLSLDSQAVQLGAVEFREFCDLPAVDQAEQPRTTTFETSEEVHLALTGIFNRMGRWAHWLPPSTAIGERPDDSWMASEKEWLQAQFTKWDAAFRPFVNSSDPPILLSLVQRRLMQVFFEQSCDQTSATSEMGWDRHLPQFQEAVQYAEAYMNLAAVQPRPSEVHGSSRRRLVFTVAMDIVLPLFFVCTKCRDPGIRRRALAMLKICDRKEGIWDSYLCAGLCERVIELEERRALQDGTIPDYARIFQMDIHLSEEVGAQVTYMRRLRDGDDPGAIEREQEIIVW